MNKKLRSDGREGPTDSAIYQRVWKMNNPDKVRDYQYRHKTTRVSKLKKKLPEIADLMTHDVGLTPEQVKKVMTIIDVVLFF